MRSLKRLRIVHPIIGIMTMMIMTNSCDNENSYKNNQIQNSTFIANQEYGAIKHQIMGEAEISVEQAETFLHQVNPNAPYLALVYQEEGEIEGVRWDIAFAQSILETGYFRFGNNVSLSQNNFAGLGATGEGVSGLTFSTPKMGIRAQIQHLKAYGSKLPLNEENVDIRFKYVTRGIAPFVEDLGNGNWAVDTSGYGYKIYNLVEKMKQVDK